MAFDLQGHLMAAQVQVVSVRPVADMSDAELGEAAAVAVDQSVTMREGAVECAIRAGELLREARRRCEVSRASWAGWLQRHWPKSRQTAQRYMALALEVQNLSGPRAGRREELLGLPSIRAALTDANYDAGSTRDEGPDAGDANEDIDLAAQRVQELSEERAQEERAPKNDKPRWSPPAAPPPRTGKSIANGVIDAAEATKRREAELAAAEERAAIRAAENRPHCTPPVGKREEPAEGDPEPYTVKAELEAIANDIEDINRRSSFLASRVAAVKFFAFSPSRIGGREVADPREVDRAELRKAADLAAAANQILADRWAARARALGRMDEDMVKTETGERTQVDMFASDGSDE